MDHGVTGIHRHDRCRGPSAVAGVDAFLKELIERLPGARIYNYYGQTELAPYHTILKAEDALTKLGSAGMGGLNMEPG